MTALEIRRVSVGSLTVDYELRRSTRRQKTLELSIDPENRVRVAAPVSALPSKIDAFVERRVPWILKRLADSRNDASLSPKRQFETGEFLDCLGRKYRLRLVNSDGRRNDRTRLMRGWLEVRVPVGTDPQTNKNRIVRALEYWYKTQAERRITERVRHYSARLGVQPKQVLIRNQRRRWGSCSADATLRFNWRVVMAPLSVVEYVVVHELCHLRHAHHGPVFWELVESLLPDYDTRRKRLRRDGPSYHL